MPAQLSPFSPNVVWLISITFRSQGSSVGVVTTLRGSGFSIDDKNRRGSSPEVKRQNMWLTCVMFDVYQGQFSKEQINLDVELAYKDHI